jgi:hypothetical protein
MDDVNPHCVRFAEKPGHQEFGRRRNALETREVERPVGSSDGGADFHLDEGEHQAPPSNEIDLPDGRPHSLGEHFPTALTQVSGRLRFGAATASFGFDTSFAQRPSSSARS